MTSLYLAIDDDQLQRYLSNYWTRITVALNVAGIKALRKIFHEDNGFSNDPTQLFNELSNIKGRFYKLKQDQIDKLFPKNKKTNSEAFDIMLLVDILVHGDIVPKPKNTCLLDLDGVLSGTAKIPQRSENRNTQNIGDAIHWLTAFKSEMDQYAKQNVHEVIGDVHWRILEYILQNLGYVTTDLEMYRTMKFFMGGPTRQPAIQAMISYLLLQDISCNVTKNHMLPNSELKKKRRKLMSSLRGLFFDLIGTLSLKEMKQYFKDLKDIKKKLFMKNDTNDSYAISTKETFGESEISSLSEDSINSIHTWVHIKPPLFTELSSNR